MVDFVADMVDFVADTVDFVADMVDFVADMVDFVADTVDFVADMVDFVADMVDFVADTVDFVADMVDFVASVYGTKAKRSTLSTFHKVDRVEYRPTWIQLCRQCVYRGFYCIHRSIWSDGITIRQIVKIGPLAGEL